MADGAQADNGGAVSRIQLKLHPKQKLALLSPATEILYGGAAGGGKALALDTPLPTPSGWTTMGSVRVGDRVLGSDGKPTDVIAATPVMAGRPCYRLTFDDGESIVADAGHEWVTFDTMEMAAWHRDPNVTGKVRTTETIAATFMFCGAANHAIMLPGEPDRRRFTRIMGCEPVESVPVRCIQVSATDSLYLAGKGMIPTHNSFLLRALSIVLCYSVPGLQVYLFRRNYGDLFKNHLEGYMSYQQILAPWIEQGLVRISRQSNQGPQIEFWNGSKLNLCHCQHDGDVMRYQGSEIHVLLIDELTHFTEKMYRFLRGRVRLGGLPVPDNFAKKLPLVVCASNPGGIGHNFVKAMFLDHQQPLECVRQPAEEGGMLRQYIPARLDDNPTLVEQDPAYLARLAGLGNPALVKAMRDGDWNIVDGGALDDVWGVHNIVQSFAVPASWYVDRSFDWGSSHPFSVLWWAEADGTEATLADGSKWCPPARSLVLVGEWYGAKGPNVGLMMAPRDVALGIVGIERGMLKDGVLRLHKRVRPGPADNAIYDVQKPGTPTIADDMEKAGVEWTRSDKSPGSRRTGLTLVRARMAEAAKDHPEEPALYVMAQCVNAIAHWPVLPRSQRDPDDCDSAAEDHDYDAMRYRVLGHRPAKAKIEGLLI